MTITILENQALNVIEKLCREQKYLDKKKAIEQLREYGIRISAVEELPEDKLSLRALDERLNDTIYVHNEWAKTVGDLQTRLVRLGESWDLNGEINTMKSQIESLEKEVAHMKKIQKQRNTLTRRRFRALELDMKAVV